MRWRRWRYVCTKSPPCVRLPVIPGIAPCRGGPHGGGGGGGVGWGLVGGGGGRVVGGLGGGGGIGAPIDEVYSATEGRIGNKKLFLAGTNNYLGLDL